MEIHQKDVAVLLHRLVGQPLQRRVIGRMENGGAQRCLGGIETVCIDGLARCGELRDCLLYTSDAADE